MQHVQKQIKDQVIIRDFNLRAGPGETVALCGGNGAGKSTVLRMLAGMMQPTKGNIAVGGLRWRDNRLKYAAMVGFMPDDYRFSPGLTAMETMVFWAKLKGLPNPENRAREALAEVGLEQTGNKPVSAFSKGMKQRVLFAQAMLAKPPLLLLDEPTNGLDPYWLESFAQLVQKAAAGGQTIIFSTHQLQMAEALADRIVFLQDGVVRLEGTAAQIRERLESSGENSAFARWFGMPRLRR
jgi:ABC-type multidrug transport system ATPase subunit